MGHDQRPAGASGDHETTLDCSVIVPFFNAERYLERCILALLDQTHPSDRYEVILVDNNSTDRSAELARRYPRVTVLEEPRQGAYSARNRGAAVARGALLAFTDADCVVVPTWLAEIVAAMNDPSVELILGGRAYGGTSLALRTIADFEHELATYVFSREAYGYAYGYTNNMAVRRSVFAHCGPFIEVGRGADSLFVCDVMEQRSRQVVRYRPSVRIRHLEITSVFDLARKKFIYGRSTRRNKRAGGRRRHDTLSNPAPSIAFRTARNNGYSLARRGLLLVLVAMTRMAFMIGLWSVRTSPSMSAAERHL